MPRHHYLLVDRTVHPLRFDGTTACYRRGDGTWQSVDGMLAERGLPLLAERCGIASYGANRNPGTLAIKMRHYDYRSPGRGEVMPVLRGRLAGAEAVAAGVSAQGYFYADLVLGDAAVLADELEVWVNLADPDQVRVLHDSEGVSGWYRAVALPPVRLHDLDRLIHPLGYLTGEPLLIPPGYATPVAFPTVPAVGRRIPALDQERLWNVVLDGWGLADLVARRTGIPAGAEQGAELMKYLNGQWWYRHHTGDQPLAGALDVITAVQERIQVQSWTSGALARLAADGAVLDTDAAYAAGPAHGLGAALPEVS